MYKSTLRLAALTSALILLACGSSNKNNDNNNQNPPPTATSTLRTWVVPESASNLDATQRAAFTAGTLYVNAHTQANASGEIRGQLDLEGTIRLATLSGAQETPSVTTNAFGAGVLSMTSDGKVRGFVVTSGLPTANLAHVHLGARGSPGGVIVPLTGGPEVWVVPDNAAALNADQRAAFTAGNLYFNVHSPANPNGEIRGQLDKVGDVRVTTLSGAQETPAVTTNAYGGGIFAFDATTREPRGFAIASGITGTLAHLHQAAKGTPGSVVVPLTGGPTLWVVPDGAPAASTDVVTAFGAGNLYANVHSTANPNGEIRGQLDQSADARLASLDGGQETPPVTTNAHGGAVIAVDSGSGAIRGFLVTEGLTNPTVAHVHPGARNAAGSPIVPLAP